jgi:hypothetical protein
MQQMRQMRQKHEARSGTSKEGAIRATKMTYLTEIKVKAER